MDVLPDERDVVAPRRRAKALRAVGVAVALGAVVYLLARSDIFGHVSDEERLRTTVESAGVLGPLVFLALMVVLVPLNVPGLVFVVPSTTLFGTAGGVALSLTGGYLASVIGVVASRRLGRQAFETRMPPRIRRLEAHLSERGFWAVVLLRTFTFLLQPADWLCGLSSMPMRTVLTGTFVGLIPPTLLIALTGGGLLDLVL
jgi:uncharacterized membrane protein YdjX (TVP38/TMEM64 family)